MWPHPSETWAYIHVLAEIIDTCMCRLPSHFDERSYVYRWFREMAKLTLQTVHLLAISVSVPFHLLYGPTTLHVPAQLLATFGGRAGVRSEHERARKI